MRTIFYNLLKRFHSGELTLEQLNMELLVENPYMVNSDRWVHYEGWINDVIVRYTKGEIALLSLKLPGSIIEIVEAIDEEETDDELGMIDFDI